MSGRRSRPAGARGGTAGPPQPRGAHFLPPRLAADLVRVAGVRPGELVLDLGAGTGALTAPLAERGARVVAVERDPRLAARLAARFRGDGRVTVVTADVLAVPLPRRPFRVVANIPFAVTTALLGRLLDPTRSPLVAAHLVVQAGVGTLLTAAHPGRPEVAWWACRYELVEVHRIPAAAFRPPPSVDAALVAARPRPALPRATLTALRTLLRTCLAAGQPLERALRGVLTRPQLLAYCRDCGLGPGTPTVRLTAADWVALAEWAVAVGYRR